MKFDQTSMLMQKTNHHLCFCSVSLSLQFDCIPVQVLSMPWSFCHYRKDSSNCFQLSNVIIHSHNYLTLANQKWILLIAWPVMRGTQWTMTQLRPTGVTSSREELVSRSQETAPVVDAALVRILKRGAAAQGGAAMMVSLNDESLIVLVYQWMILGINMYRWYNG